LHKPHTAQSCQVFFSYFIDAHFTCFLAIIFNQHASMAYLRYIKVFKTNMHTNTDIEKFSRNSQVSNIIFITHIHKIVLLQYYNVIRTAIDLIMKKNKYQTILLFFAYLDSVFIVHNYNIMSTALYRVWCVNIKNTRTTQKINTKTNE